MTSEEIAQAAGDIAHWQRRAQQAEAKALECLKANGEVAMLNATYLAALDTAYRALMSYAHGNTAPALAKEVADHVLQTIEQAGQSPALLAELEAARTAIEAARKCLAVRRENPEMHDRLAALSSAIHAYDQAVKARPE